MTVYSVYITCADMEEAERIAEALIDERLAACINILGPIRSIYRWEGKIERGEEVALIAKTAEERLAVLQQKVIRMHSASTPCITAWEVAAGHTGYLNWVRQEVNGPPLAPPPPRRRPSSAGGGEGRPAGRPDNS